jgi:hypothetical protein
MVMTSDTARHELSRIETLIDLMRNSLPASEDDIEDIRWLNEQRTYLRALLASRRAQRGKRLVRLDVWRDGSFGCASRTREAA